MKITKKDFISALTSNESIFLGVSMKKRYSADELSCTLSDFLNKDGIYNTRTCKKCSDKRLMFSGGSVLLLDQKGKYNFYNEELSGKTRKISVFVCELNTVLSGGENYTKCMYYSIDK